MSVDNESNTSNPRDCDQATTPSYYIALGASAGGLEALQEFFQHMPADSGATFIVVQHLSPDFKSVMDELLGRGTRMKVLHASDGATVEADTVYLIPPRKNMMIAEGKLLLEDQMPERGINFPIDTFFRSLAEDQHHRTICIVLSGTGSDGSRGIQAVKEVGGLVIVQDPVTAQFDGMPRSAVNTGLADVVLAPKEMPGKLINYINHPMISGKGQSLINSVEANSTALQGIFDHLKQHSEIDFTQYKASTVARRIERRIGINQLNSLDEYLQLMLRRPQELQTLAKDMLIGVTRFFRDPEMFQDLENRVIPDILDHTPSEETIRIWVAGCSTGEEAYSLAILFDRCLRARGEGRSVKIFATDVDPDAIAEASAGQFSLSTKDDIDEHFLQEYFILENDQYLLKPHVRQMVVFAVHNLLEDPPFSNIHLACCRNVLIYFQPNTQKRVLSLLHFALQKDGYLFLGPSETLGELQPYFEVIHERYRLYKKVVTARIVPDTAAPVHSNLSGAVPTVPSLLRSYRGADRTMPSAQITDALIGAYVPPCIVLDANQDIIHVYGDVSHYTQKLKAGRFSANIKDIIQDDLSVALSTALHRAHNKQEDVHYQNVQLQREKDTTVTIDLKVRYLKDEGGSDTRYLVLFENMEELDRNRITDVIDYNQTDHSQQRIQDLETELQKKQEHLQVTVEELETTNEELQSSNEELMAANEELQSTNEELQSVNEELYTVNTEYQRKIEQLTQLNGDMDNLLRSTCIGIIFLDETMMIRNFTAPVTDHIYLVPEDVGRPFHHISHQLTYDTLLKDVAAVIEHSNTIEKEVHSANSGSVLVRITPYMTERGEAEGCVVSLTDISEVRQLKGALLESYEELQATINHALKAQTRHLKVLLVDDAASDAERITRFLADIPDLAMDIITASSAREAVERLTDSDIDVCFIDYRLGGDTAFDVIRNLAKDGIHNAFILLSGLIDEDLKAEALELGIYDCVDKDVITPALLERCVRYTLRHKQTEQYLSRQESFEPDYETN